LAEIHDDYDFGESLREWTQSRIAGTGSGKTPEHAAFNIF